ncbi:MAG TPA: hypothetical protein VFP68_25165 [Burkholderiaceae bacterium]|nr:hypothetical protein [Burkholderiaceae bacterium]
MRMSLHTVWQSMELVVQQNDREVDRIPAHDIQRVILVCRAGGETPGDLSFAIIETVSEAVVLPAESGIAGRVHFERQSFWSERNCVYWVDGSQVSLPRGLRSGFWLLGRQRPGYMHVPRSDVDSAIDQWPLQGPQTWEQRKWERIARYKLLAPLDQAPRRGRQEAKTKQP